MYLGYDIDNILLIDNNIYSFENNKDNAIPIIDFLGDYDDRELFKLEEYI